MVRVKGEPAPVLPDPTSALTSAEVSVQVWKDGKLAYEGATLEAVAADAQMVLQEQIRNSILQVVHR